MSKRRIHTIGSRNRLPTYLSACAALVILGGITLPVANTLGLEKHQARAQVVEPEHLWKLKTPINTQTFLEFDKNKNLKVEVLIEDGPHAGEMAVAHYSHLQKWAGERFDGAGELEKGTKVNIEYTQRRLTDNLRVRRITR